jgi:hypothetical protein
MSKTIVGRDQIPLDPKLAIVKKFRCLNKKLGMLKRELLQIEAGEGDETNLEDIQTEFAGITADIKTASEEATAAGFKIWINPNGNTGHTYEKDYKTTSDADNDEAESKRALARMTIIRRMAGFGISLN